MTDEPFEMLNGDEQRSLLTTPFDAATARAYIRYFRTHVLPGCDHVDTDQPRRIWLDTMSDEDAVFVAEQFARMVEEAARLRRALGLKDS